jgi:hypothetical protein
LSNLKSSVNWQTPSIKSAFGGLSPLPPAATGVVKNRKNPARTPQLTTFFNIFVVFHRSETPPKNAWNFGCPKVWKKFGKSGPGPPKLLDFHDFWHRFGNQKPCNFKTNQTSKNLVFTMENNDFDGSDPPFSHRFFT